MSISIPVRIFRSISPNAQRGRRLSLFAVLRTMHAVIVALREGIVLPESNDENQKRGCRRKTPTALQSLYETEAKLFSVSPQTIKSDLSRDDRHLINAYGITTALLDSGLGYEDILRAIVWSYEQARIGYKGYNDHISKEAKNEVESTTMLARIDFDIHPLYPDNAKFYDGDLLTHHIPEPRIRL